MLHCIVYFAVYYHSYAVGGKLKRVFQLLDLLVGEAREYPVCHGHIGVRLFADSYLYAARIAEFAPRPNPRPRATETIVMFLASNVSFVIN